MTTLTTLPLALQSRILSYVCDIRLIYQRSQLHGTNYYILSRYARTQISLDSLHAVDIPLPTELLAPALASPVLAAAAKIVIGPRLSYLTDANTEGHLPLWVKAFATYVQAVGITDVGEVWKDALPRDLRRKMVEKQCWDAADLFREITMNHVRLKVLDVVHLPFDRSERMQDALMAGLCATLESCQSTLKELALPVFSKSDFCARALERTTLPHLTVLAIELNDKRWLHRRYWDECHHLGGQLLEMLRAVDGHADRLRGLTTLEELRLRNVYSVPFTSLKESGCSPGFFRAIKTLRMSMNPPRLGMVSGEPEFFLLFKELEVLHWTGIPGHWYGGLEKLSKRLKEMHFCHTEWITGAQVGIQYVMRYNIFHAYLVLEATSMTERKCRTLVTHGWVSPHQLRRMARNCPNLGYLSLYVSYSNLSTLRSLIQRCEQLAGLQISIDEYNYGHLGEDGWLRLGQVIPRYHRTLRDVAIQTRWTYSGPTIPAHIAVMCFKGVVERMGARAERLLFRANLEVRNVDPVVSSVRCILDSCVDYARVVSHVEIDLIPWNHRRRVESDEASREELVKLACSRDRLIQRQVGLKEVGLGICHRLLYKMECTEDINMNSVRA